jgi:aminotransferase
VRPADEVVLPSISYVGAANAVAAAGARPVFCDVDPRTLNATAESIAAKITSRTRAVLILHYGGLPCEMDAICSLAERTGIALIEDSACSVASTYRGKACGTLGDIGVWSSGFSNAVPQRWWEFEVAYPGRRAIMNDIASAIGLEQLEKLRRFIDRRRQIQAFYDDVLGNLGWLQTPPPPPHYADTSYYMYWIQTPPNIRDRLAVHLRAHGIYTTFRYLPLHRRKLYGAHDHLPHAETAAETTLCLPLHQALSDEDTGRVADAILTFGR